MNSDIAHLIRDMAQGDRSALTELYNGTSRKIFGILMHILRHHSDAEDALQNVYIKAWRNAPKFDPSRSGQAWLISIARNHAVDMLRQRRRRAPDDREIEDIVDTALNPDQSTIIRQDLMRCLGALQRDHAEIIVDVYLSGLSYQEVADKHRAPVNTVRTWIRRSVLKLRACLEHHDGA